MVHLLRNSFLYAARQNRDKTANVLKPGYTAPTKEASETVGEHREEFTPFLRFDLEIRRIVCAANAIGSVNARIRREFKARGHFPNEQATLKCIYTPRNSSLARGNRT
ncbi:transposase [Streptomyces sp. PSKA30]|nr:transposase [Streptomyces sp. PSKA30]MBZ9641112.1 transposase [Streptomyces sp. PSKA30]